MKEFKPNLKGFFGRPFYLILTLLFIELAVAFLQEISETQRAIFSVIWPFPGFSVVLLPFCVLFARFQLNRGMYDSFRITVTENEIEGPKSYFKDVKTAVSVDNQKKLYKEFLAPNFFELKILRKPRSHYPRIKIAFKDIDYTNSYPKKNAIYPYIGQIKSKKGDAIVLAYYIDKHQLRDIAEILRAQETITQQQ